MVAGGLGGYVVDDAVYALDLVDDAHRDLIEHVVGNACPVGSHEVRRCYRAQCKSIVIGPAVTHYADGAHIRENREILIHRALEVRLCDLVAEDKVCLAQDIELFLRDIANNTDGKAGAGKWLTHYQYSADQAHGRAHEPHP